MPEYFMKFITDLPVWGLWVFWIITPLLWAFLLLQIVKWVLEMTHTDPI
jgi:hypothetical protein